MSTDTTTAAMTAGTATGTMTGTTAATDARPGVPPDRASAGGVGATRSAGTGTPAIAIENLHVRFTAHGKVIRAVNGVSLNVARGEALALIGESGSGKSVTLRAMMRLHSPRTTTIEGRLDVAGEAVMGLSPGALAKLRGGKVAMVFQEPLLALDPVYTVGRQIAETVRTHRRMSRAAARQRALELLQAVRIPSPERRLDAYPHEMSGGMRQRAMIALSLAGDPQILLADEPTTALDATVQIQVLILLRELQRDLGLSIVFVTHDIGAAVEIADRIAVMYGGVIVEEGTIHQVMRDPCHPYTLALLKSRREGGMEKGQRLEAIGGAPPDLSKDIPGCPFAPRCSHVMPVCTTALPPPVTVSVVPASSASSVPMSSASTSSVLSASRASAAASAPPMASALPAPAASAMSVDHTVRCYLYGADGTRIESVDAVKTVVPGSRPSADFHRATAERTPVS